MKWRVLISAPYMLPVIEEFRDRLEAEGIEIVIPSVRERLSEDELLAIVKGIDGVVCGDDRFTERVLLQADRLKVISKWGTGIDSIDTGAAARLGITVYNTPNAFTEPLADTVLGYMLCFARRLPWMDQEMRRGLWAKSDARALSECTLGVIGLGNTGQAVISRAQAFGMKLLGCDPVPVSPAFIAETGIELMPLDDLLAQSDFVSLNCDLNPSSFHLIGAKQLALMKPSAYLINTARGSVVDEPALIEALRNQRIAGAALDVFEVEPLPADSPLRSMENCLMAPHNANSSPAARQRVHESTIANLLNGLRACQNRLR
jgi:D-3-phosphoglycerate dehydrogenase / 2-oxoglutarate reductase